MRLVVFWLPLLTNALVVPVSKRAVATRLSAATLKRTEAPPLDVKNEAPPVDEATAAETDRTHGFVEGPSVAFWQKYAPPAEGGIDNLRAAAAKALQSGAKGADAMRYYGYHLARATFFAGQGAAGVIAYQASASSAPYRGDPATTEPSKGPPRSPAFELPTLVDTMGALFAEAVATYEQDFGEVQKGTFPLPWDMVDGVRNRQTSPLFLADQARRYVNEAISILTKRNRRDPGDFGVPYGGNADLYPDYYLNNFHFQTDGWLSSDSAKLYETSTETLFLGRQDSMQRLALYPMRSWAATDDFKVLEVACGTGRLNTFLRDAYPRMDVSAVDLSPFYLEEARGHAKRWEAFRRRTQPSQRVGTAKFAQANAEKLPQADESVDVVVNVYLFHELPHEARRAAAAEMARVCKPGGLVVWVDSVQTGDRPALDATLGNFQYLNEPHYPTYIGEDVGALFMDAGLEPFEKHTSSTSKCLSFVKPCADDDDYCLTKVA